MAAVPPKSDLYGLKHSAGDMIQAAFNRGVKYGRYLEREAQIEAGTAQAKELAEELGTVRTENSRLSQECEAKDKRIDKLEKDNKFLETFYTMWKNTNDPLPIKKTRRAFTIPFKRKG